MKDPFRKRVVVLNSDGITIVRGVRRGYVYKAHRRREYLIRAIGNINVEAPNTISFADDRNHIVVISIIGDVVMRTD